MQALFGKRPTEKDPAKGTSSAVDFTLRGPGAAMRPAYPACGVVSVRASLMEEAGSRPVLV